MNPVETYIYKQEGNQQQIMTFFHDIFVNQYKLSANIKWNIPTYFGTTWVAYLNPDKKTNGVHVCFMRGNELSEKHVIVKSEGRKMVKSILITSIETIPYEALIKCIEEAVLLDKTVKFKAPNSKK